MITESKHVCSGFPAFFPVNPGLHHSSDNEDGPQCTVSPGLLGACFLGVRQGCKACFRRRVALRRAGLVGGLLERGTEALTRTPSNRSWSTPSQALSP